jgi:hypothetical protein
MQGPNIFSEQLERCLKPDEINVYVDTLYRYIILKSKKTSIAASQQSLDPNPDNPSD